MTAIYDRNDESSVHAAFLERDDVKRGTPTLPLSSSQPIVPTSHTVMSDDWYYSITRQYMTGCVDALFTKLELFGMTLRKESKQIQNSYSSTVDHWTKCAEKLGDGGWMKWSKWKFAAFVHAMTPQLDVAPPAPDNILDNPKYLAHGIAGRYAIHLSRSDLGPAFLQSVSVLKKGCPRPGDDELKKELKSTFDTLTSVQPVRAEWDWKSSRLLDDLEWGDERLENVSEKLVTDLTLDSAKEQLRRTVRELFTGHSFELFEKQRSPLYMPSTSSSYNSSRAKGGALNDIYKVVKKFDLSDKDPNLGFHPEESPFIERDYYRVTTDRVLNKFSNLTRRLRGAYVHGGESVDVKDNKVNMVALSEALKVRVITKGNPYRSFLLQPVQKFMWNLLSKHKIFELIANPVTEDIVRGAMGKRLGEGIALLSGDYSGATNNLAPWASECVAQEIIKVCGMDEVTGKLFLEALTLHELEDPLNKGTFKKQLHGQLMGSIVSFPILCIINAAVCRWAIEIDRLKPTLLRDCPLLINGDDCLFKCSNRGLNAWKRISSYFGLKPSLGKFFFTRQFAQINSMNFYYFDQPTDGKYYKETEYINMGLFYGLSRSKNESEDINLQGAGLNHRCRELIAKCPAILRTTVMGRFLDQHRATLTSRFANIPWFVPEEFGGLGLPIFLEQPVVGTYPLNGLDRKWQPTDMDLRVCHSFKTYGMPEKISLPVAWRIRNEAVKNIPIPHHVSTIEDPTSTDLIQFMSVSMMFQARFDKLFTKLTTEKVEKSYVKRISKLKKKWSDTIKRGKLPPALSIKSVMEVQPEFKVYSCYLENRGVAVTLEEARAFRNVFANADKIEQLTLIQEELWD